MDGGLPRGDGGLPCTCVGGGRSERHPLRSVINPGGRGPPSGPEIMRGMRPPAARTRCPLRYDRSLEMTIMGTPVRGGGARLQFYRTRSIGQEGVPVPSGAQCRERSMLDGQLVMSLRRWPMVAERLLVNDQCQCSRRWRTSTVMLY